MLWIILVIVLAIFIFLVLVICKAGGMADEAIEKLYREQENENPDKETRQDGA